MHRFCWQSRQQRTPIAQDGVCPGSACTVSCLLAATVPDAITNGSRATLPTDRAHRSRPRAVQIFWNAFLSTLAHTGVDAPMLDTDEVRDVLQSAADALPEPLHVQARRPPVCALASVRGSSGCETLHRSDGDTCVEPALCIWRIEVVSNPCTGWTLRMYFPRV